MGKEQAIKDWQPTMDYLTNDIKGYEFKLIPLSFEEIDNAVKNGHIEFIITNTSIYVELDFRYKISRIATMENLALGKGYTMFGGVIFTRADRTNINSLDDLRMKKFAAVNTTSLGGWRMAYDELKKKGIDPYKDFLSLTFLNDHPKVVLSVYNGLSDAGTVRTDVLERMAAKGEIDLKKIKVIPYKGAEQDYETFPFLLSTPLYPEWPIAKIKHTPDSLAKLVVSSLLKMPSDSPAAQSAKIAGWTIALNYDTVHDLLKYLRISPYENYGVIKWQDFIRQYWKIVGMIFLFILTMISLLIYIYRLNLKLKMVQKELTIELNARVKAETELAVRNKNLEDIVNTKVKEIRRNEQLLIQQTKMAAMGEMIGAIAHQWKQPLNSISLLIQDIKYAYAAGELDSDYLNNSLKQTFQQIAFMSKTIDEFSNFFKPKTEKETFNIIVLVGEVFSLLSSQFKINSISYKITCHVQNLTFKDYSEILIDNTTMITTYKNQLAHVLLNIINNAKDAIISKKQSEKLHEGLIVIDCYNDNAIVKVEISDNAGGIPEEIIENIFEPYFTTKADKGTGIGLYMSKVIMEESLGGRISVRNIENGATFKLELNTNAES
jgi:signal transduction histidine kinase